MNILVTAGNTRTMIDRVRCITNVFTGRTGANIAAEAARRGHSVTLLTSHPEVLPPTSGLTVRAYQTFDELAALMADEIPNAKHDAVIHSAAVSDYHVGGVYVAPASDGTTRPPLTDVSAGKVKGSHPELWLRLTPAPKLVDKVRTGWDFRGVLVKFKLEVGVSESELQQIAERSRLHSHADLMSANTLDGAAEWALVGAGEYTKVLRANLAAEIVSRVEQLAVTSPSCRRGGT